MLCRVLFVVMCVVWRVLCDQRNRDRGMEYILPQDTSEDHHMTEMMVSTILNNLSPKSRGVFLYGTLPDSVYISIASANIRLVVTTSIPEFTIINENIHLGEFKYIDMETDIGVCVFYMQSFLEISLALVDTLVHQIYDFRGTKWMVVPKRGQQIQPEMIFYLFYWYNILDCVIIFIDEEGANGDLLYMEYTPYVTHSPYKAATQFSCWSDKNRLAVYDGKSSGFISCNKTCLDIDHDHQADDVHFLRCLELTWRKMSDSLPMFPDKTKNLNGFPLYLLAMHTPPSLKVDKSKEGIDRIQGKDANLIKVLAEKMNFSLKYRKSLDEINTNPVFDNMVRGYMDLFVSQHDISANVIYLTQYAFPPMNFIYPVEGGGLCFITHKAGEVDMMVQSYTMFKVEVVALLLVSALIIVYLTQLSLKKYTKSGEWDRIGKAFSYIFRIYLSLSIPYRGHTYVGKWMLIGLIWCTFVIDYFLQSQLFSAFYTRPMKKQIDTLQDLYDSGLNIEGLPSTDAFLPPFNELNIKINDRFVPTDTMYECVDYVKTHSDKACWLECNLARDLSRMYRDDNGKLIIHVGKEHSHDFYLSYPIARDSPLLNRITYLTKKIFECGLMKIWRESMLHAKPEDVSVAKALNMSEFEGVFFLVIFFYALSIVVFILELICARIHYTKFNVKSLFIFKSN